MSSSKKHPATASDVAKLANVSQSTVSRAFADDPRISVGTRERIKKLAEQLGYRPNALARSLITRKSNLVGVAVGNLANPYFSSALEEMSVQFAKAGLKLLIFPAHLDTPIEHIINYRIEALVMLSVPISEELQLECDKAQIPVIIFNRASETQNQYSVLGDNYFGSQTIAAFLLAGEHKKISFVAIGDKESTASNEREQGLVDYLDDNKLSLFSREQAEFIEPGVTNAIRRLLVKPERPDAIYCANDHVAIKAVLVAQSEFGLQIGKDLSIVGFDNVPEANWPGISLTTYSQPIENMVEATLNIILALRDGMDVARNKIISGDLIVRASSKRPVIQSN
ncbi:MAG: sugar-binding protein [Alteromonadaceae bacterium]|nr:sugar-binding protein [Alteromonadaceae bacterium]